MKIKLGFSGCSVSTTVEEVRTQYYADSNKPKSIHVTLTGVNACAELFIENPSEPQLRAFGYYNKEDSNEQPTSTQHQGKR